jgi:hypothetical protein
MRSTSRDTASSVPGDGWCTSAASARHPLARHPQHRREQGNERTARRLVEVEPVAGEVRDTTVFERERPRADS